MSSSVLSAVMDRFINDENFRDQMRNDPGTAIRNSEMLLSDEELTMVLRTDWAKAGEELGARVSKGLVGN
jgi:hypothetical protein